MKKLLSVLLAAMLLLAMAGVAGAAAPEEATGGITFTGVVLGEKVDVYKVIEYTYDTKSGQYTDAKWVDAIQQWISGTYNVSNLAVDETPNGVSETAFYEAMRAYIVDEAKWSPIADYKSGLRAGSYICLISGGSTVHQLHLVSLTPQQKDDGTWELISEAVDATQKASRPVLDKTMTAEGKGTKQDHDTVAIGDTVTFDIYATVPEYPDDVDENHKTHTTYTITDTMAKGLTLNRDSIKVSLIGKEQPLVEETDYTLTIHDANVDHGFTIDFKYNSIKSAATGEVRAWNSEAGAGYEGRVDTTDKKFVLDKGVHIQYTAVVNSGIQLESDENENHAKLVYSNNPYGESTSEINDEVKVYTYGLKINKVDGKSGTALAGAEFEINVKDKGDEKLYFVPGNGAGEYIVAKSNASGAVTKLITPDSGKITIKGLDVGKYELREITAPENYNKLTQPVEFEITPLKADDDKGTVTMKYVKDGYEEIGVEKKPSAYLPETINNFTGIQVPSTGGMGTTIFMVAGIAVMACAVVALMLVLKRQKHSEG